MVMMMKRDEDVGCEMYDKAKKKQKNKKQNCAAFECDFDISCQSGN